MNRTFKVYYTENSNNDIVEFFVTDITSEELDNDYKFRHSGNDNRLKHEIARNEYTRPRIATFPISQLYDEDTQQRMAKMLCDYMNKIEEAKEKAIRNTTLIDALSIP